MRSNFSNKALFCFLFTLGLSGYGVELANAADLFFSCGDQSQAISHDTADDNDTTITNTDVHFDLVSLNNEGSTPGWYDCKDSGGAIIAKVKFTNVGPASTSGILVQTGAIHYIWLKGVRIDVDRVVTNLELAFWREINGVGGNHDYVAEGGGQLRRGSFTPAEDSALVFQGETASHKILTTRSSDPPNPPCPAGTDPLIKCPVCPPGFCSWTIGVFSMLQFTDMEHFEDLPSTKVVKGRAWLKTNSTNDWLNLPQYNNTGLRVAATTAGGAGGEGGDGDSDIEKLCKECEGEECLYCIACKDPVPKRHLGWAILTTYATIKEFYPSNIVDDEERRKEKIKHYAAVNWENLSQDLAKGNGEYLSSLGTLLSVAEVHKPAFYATAQEQFADWSREGGVRLERLLVALEKALQKNPLSEKPPRVAMK